MLTQASFFILGLCSVFLSIVMLTRKWPVTAAMLLIVVMMMLAGMYGVLGAHFSAVSQILVYAGAIMVVFVFVIMLLNIPTNELRYGRVTLFEWLLIFFGVCIAVLLGTRVGQGYLMIESTAARAHARAPYYPVSFNENVKNVSSLLFTDYLWAFELVSFLILAAIVGSVVIAKKARVNHVNKSS